MLDLRECAISSQAAVEPLRALPALTRLLLAGNPLAAAGLQAARRAAQRRDKAAAMAADGALLPPGALRHSPEDPLMVLEQVAVQVGGWNKA